MSVPIEEWNKRWERISRICESCERALEGAIRNYEDMKKTHDDLMALDHPKKTQDLVDRAKEALAACETNALDCMNTLQHANMMKSFLEDLINARS